MALISLIVFLILMWGRDEFADLLSRFFAFFFKGGAE
jgi:hypothetical protein